MTINTQSLREQIYYYLRDEMIEGRLAPGAVIDQTGISRELGISKTPLRDALIQLECEGFVTILPRKGVVVNQLSLQEVDDFYSIIGVLEAAVIIDVFDRLDARCIRRLKQLNADQRTAFSTGEHITYYHLNLEFHGVFLELSPNRTLNRLILPMKQRLYDFPRLAYVPEWEINNMAEHDQLIEAIESGAAAAAAALLKDRHWSFAYQEPYIRKFYAALESESVTRKEHRRNDTDT